jgi:epsilon-lactone hydrolase
VLVYTHGGAYTLLSAYSTLGCSLLVAHETGLRVISVDYTVAPFAKYDQITDEIMAVFKALSEERYRPQDIAIYGDSAGGSLAAGVVLKMRDKGFAMPAAVVLFSPWADITKTGDTYVTLSHAETNFIYEKHLKPCADAYANPEDQKNPYVSPVYGDYTKGFPPTLIQGGTKEIFLSNFIRLYQALDTAGQTVKLDLYEGMPHIFQWGLPGSRESKLALKKMKQFLYKHLH